MGTPVMHIKPNYMHAGVSRDHKSLNRIELSQFV